MAKPLKAEIADALVVPIVADAGLATTVADGRLLPVLILDTRARPDVKELIRVHAYLPPGDARSQWGSSPDNDDRIVLHLVFVQPMAVELALLFSIEHQAILVETMLTGRAVYLQAGETPDRLTATLDAPKVLVELPDMGFRPVWEKLLLRRMTAVMSRRLGVRRRDGQEAAQEAIARVQKLARLQLKR